MSIRLQYSPTIQLGHVITALSIVGSVFSATLWLSLTIQAKQLEIVNTEERHHAEVLADLLLKQYRIDQNDKAIATSNDSQKQFQTDMRSQLTDLTKSIYDLHVLVASQGSGIHK
jgi:hypothetical protein